MSVIISCLLLQVNWWLCYIKYNATRFTQYYAYTANTISLLWSSLTFLIRKLTWSASLLLLPKYILKSKKKGKVLPLPPYYLYGLAGAFLLYNIASWLSPIRSTPICYANVYLACVVWVSQHSWFAIFFQTPFLCGLEVDFFVNIFLFIFPTFTKYYSIYTFFYVSSINIMQTAIFCYNIQHIPT